MTDDNVARAPADFERTIVERAMPALGTAMAVRQSFRELRTALVQQGKLPFRIIARSRIRKPPEAQS
jgi:hypothetical protein